MSLKRLKEDALKLILLGGKGGVGKTTCATCTSIYLSEYFKTLLISTDPAHSLSDSLGQKIEDEITEVKGVRNLSALEISAEKSLSRFKAEHDYEIKKLLDTSSYLDHDDIDAIVSLPIPGIDEVMGFKTIADLIEGATFDKYIVDTAPTGHALRLLTLPGLLDDWIKVMAKMRWKYRYMVETFTGKYVPDECDSFLLNMKKLLKKINGLLKDQNRCEFIAVTIPEDMAILETERLISSLTRYGIRVKQLIINNVQESQDCMFCKERKEGQGKHISRIRDKFSNLEIKLVPLQPREIKGIESLRKFTGCLFNNG